jgi:hypothetical protein
MAGLGCCWLLVLVWAGQLVEAGQQLPVSQQDLINAHKLHRSRYMMRSHTVNTLETIRRESCQVYLHKDQMKNPCVWLIT